MQVLSATTLCIAVSRRSSLRQRMGREKGASLAGPRSLLVAKTSERPGVLPKPRVVAQRLHSCDVEWHVPEADGSPVHMCSLQVPRGAAGDAMVFRMRLVRCIVILSRERLTLLSSGWISSKRMGTEASVFVGNARQCSIDG